MAFKDEIETLCERAKEGEEVVIQLPITPAHYTDHMKAEKFFQLEHLLEKYDCGIKKINLTDYKIHVLEE